MFFYWFPRSSFFTARLWPPPGVAYVVAAVFLARIAFLGWLGHWPLESWAAVPLMAILQIGLVRFLWLRRRRRSA